MRLISSFSDYYDPMFAHGSEDKKNIFKRESRELNFVGTGPHNYNVDNVPRVFSFECHDKKFNYDMRGGVIGFCGSLYPFLRVDSRPRGVYTEAYGSKYYYTFERMCDDISGLMTDDEIKYPSGVRNYHQKISDIEFWLRKGNIRQYKGVYCIREDKKLIDLFLKEKVAYFSGVGSPDRCQTSFHVTLYPKLKDYDFYKIYGCPVAHQSIVMYLNNQIAKPDSPHIDPVSDKIKAESHGFDKFSFRKEKKSVKK